MPRKKKNINQDINFDSVQDLFTKQLQQQQQENTQLDDILSEFDREKQKTKKKKREFYVKKTDLLNQIRKYQQSKLNSKDGQGVISEQLGEMVLKICTRFSLLPKFFGYSYRDEMVADAVMRCLTKGLDKIDTNNPDSNPFSYLTQIAFNCFRARINNQKKFMNTKQRFRDEYYGDFEHVEGLKQTDDNFQCE